MPAALESSQRIAAGVLPATSASLTAIGKSPETPIDATDIELRAVEMLKAGAEDATVAPEAAGGAMRGRHQVVELLTQAPRSWRASEREGMQLERRTGLRQKWPVSSTARDIAAAATMPFAKHTDHERF